MPKSSSVGQRLILYRLKAKSGSRETTHTEAALTVMDLAEDAGGLNDFASGITVERKGRKLVDVYVGGGSPKLRKSKFMNTPLKPGDRVRVGHMKYRPGRDHSR